MADPSLPPRLVEGPVEAAVGRPPIMPNVAVSRVSLRRIYNYVADFASSFAQGTGYTGSTTCASPYTCTYSSQYYSQCL